MSRCFEYVNRVINNGYETITPKFELPKRSTKNSAGYDFINPKTITIQPNEIVYVLTGIKAKMQDDEVLLLANRSSNPKKKGLILVNGIGVIDADYYNNKDNEGEIAFAFQNIRTTPITIEKGEKLGQGIFIKYAIVDNDRAEAERIGGFGSSGK